MRSFAIFSFLALANAAAVHKQECDKTVTSTVTPAPITANEEYYHNVYYTTSTVTRLALQSSQTAANAATAPTTASNTPIKRACAAATHTETVTASPSTTTVYTTQTRTLAARVTQTIAACQPNNNFGLFRGTLAIRSSGGALASTESFPNLSSAGECCHACFTSAAGCMAWSFDGSVYGGDAQQGCTMSLMKNRCPPQDGTQAWVYENNEKEVVGAGPCVVEQ